MRKRGEKRKDHRRPRDRLLTNAVERRKGVSSKRWGEIHKGKELRRRMIIKEGQRTISAILRIPQREVRRFLGRNWVHKNQTLREGFLGTSTVVWRKWQHGKIKRRTQQKKRDAHGFVKKLQALSD